MKLALLAVTIALSASASAQTVVTASNATYSLTNVRAINYNTFSNSMELTMMNGSVNTFSQNGLAVYNSVVQSVGGTTAYATFIRVDGTYLYVRTSAAINVFCSGGKTAIGWANTGSQDINDNCALFNKIKAAGINGGGF